MSTPTKGLKIGHYRLGPTLGVGSFGKVKLAEHEVTGNRVAVKIVNRQKIRSLAMDTKIRREIQILQMFKHPHIVKLYEVIETPSDIFMVMEYVAGGELFDYIVKHGKLSEKLARKFLQQIISAVDYCHRHMVVHRDLKPENLLVSEGESVKIGDFGLSNLMQDGDFLATSCGSPNYAAPEVISGQLYAGPEVDVWSCGVILYALVCGRLPFDDEYIPALFRKIRSGEYVMPAEVSPPCREIISKMLVVDPLRRATIPELLEHPWLKEDMPLYIAERTRPTSTGEKTDLRVIDELAKKFGVDRAFTMKELAQESTDGKPNQFSVAYDLVYDNLHGFMEKANTASQTAAEKLAMLSASPPVSLRDMKSIIRVTPDKRRPEELAHRRTSSSGGDVRTSWKLGVSSREKPDVIMKRLLKTLKANAFEWKFVSRYRLRARTRDASDSPVKIAVQLFMLTNEVYLVDFKRLDGQLCHFFCLCEQLMRHFEASPF